MRRLNSAAGLLPADEGRLSLAPSTALPATRSVIGMRYLLPPSEGSGYWDFFSASDHMLISVGDAVVKCNQWVTVDDSDYFKLRVMLSGRLLNRKLQTVLEGGQAAIHVSPRMSDGGGGHFIEANLQMRMVVLHVHKDLLTGVLGFGEHDVPAPLNRMLGPTYEEVLQKVAAGPKILQAATDMVDSRHEMPANLRTRYLESKAMELLCQLTAELVNRNTVRELEVRMSPRELNCLYEARDYLAQHFVAPPTISKLARMVGINQTKLKSSFKRVVGMTVYNFIIQRRMQRAADLLLTDDYSISEVSYLVGYDYPANFSFAFKKHFGVLPKAWRDRHVRSQ